MGVFWTVWPLDEDVRRWLTEIQVPFPDQVSRFPVGGEIKRALTDLPGYQVEITDNGIGASWQALITSESGADEGPWTLLNVSEYTGDELPQKLWFEKGWESLITTILERLVPACGPLVLIPDTGGTPTVISP